MTLSCLRWWQRKPRMIIMVLVPSSADSGWSAVFVTPRHFRWHKLSWKSCKSLWAKTWSRAHKCCRERWLSEMEGDGEKVCVSGTLNTGGNYVIYADGTSLTPLQLWHKENIFAHFSAICHFYCAKARFYKCSLSLRIKSRVCKVTRMWGRWKKRIGFHKEILHCVAETGEPKGLLSVKAQNLRNKF